MTVGRLNHIAFGLALLVLLAGCAHDKAFVQVASLTAASTVKLKTSMGAYVDQANALRTDAALNVQTLQDLARARGVETAAARQSWMAAGDAKSKKALAIFDAVSAFGHDGTLSVAPPPLFGEAAPTVAQLKFDSTTYDTLTKQLTALAKPTSLQDEIQSLNDYGKAVETEYSKDVKAAAEAANKAAEAGAKNTSSTIAATAAPGH